MLQQGTGVYVRDSPDIICGRKPTPKPEPVLVPIVTDSLISTQRPALVQIPKMQIHRNVHTTTGDQAPQIPSGAFQQIDLGKSRSLPRGHSRFILDKPSTREQSVEPTEELTPIQPIILPSREDEIRQSSMEAGTSQESVEATSQKIPSTTDIIDRPNVVLPFPVPFLKRGPNLSESKKVESTDMPSTSQVFHTLPPSILIEPGSTPKVAQPSTEANIKSEHIDEFALASSNSNEPTLQPRLEKSFFTTTIIFICVGTAVIVLVVVIAGLCISKHRQLQFENTYSDSSAARTSEYISTQYRQNSLRGTGGRVGRFEESPAWIYNPGSSYCNYYK